MIHSILKIWPDLGSRQVWNVLKEDVISDTRRFDVDCINDEIDSEQITRFGVGAEVDVTTGFSRFKNLVYEVKKAIKCHAQRNMTFKACSMSLSTQLETQTCSQQHKVNAYLPNKKPRSTLA